MLDETFCDRPSRRHGHPTAPGIASVGRPDAGLTLIEIMITTGIMVIGLVLLMSTMVSLANQSKVVDAATAGTHFSMSCFDSMIGLTFDQMMQFNSTEDIFDANEGVVNLEGVGNMEVTVQAVIPGDGDPTLISLPMSDEDLAGVGDIPNPVEIQVKLKVVKGGDEYGTTGYQFSASRMVYYN